MSNAPDYLVQASYRYKLDKARQLSVERDSDPVAWIQKHFYIPETNAPIQLVPYQAAVVREALRRDAKGDFVYSLILYSDIKKSAKSTISGAIALYLAWHNAWESVRIVGNDLKQADSRTFFYIKRAIELNPRLRDQCNTKQFNVTLPNHTGIQAIPVDPKGEAGGGDLITCFTELWAMKNEASQRLWSETTLSPLKFGKSLRLAESYAGFTGQSPILENLYEVGVKQGKLIGEEVGIPDLELYRNESARMLTLWNTTPRCPWQTADYYAQEAATLLPSEFQRMHRNQWQDAVDTFVPYEWWHGCKVDSLPALRYRQGVIMALDAGVNSDCFALVLVSKDEGMPTVRHVKIWKPPQGGKLDFAEPESEIRRLCKEYNVVCVAYDPYQLHDMATRLNHERIAFFEAFTQGTPRLIADKLLYDTIRDKRLRHYGDPELDEHIKNAYAKTEGDKLRIVKGTDSNRKIDACVSLSMAVERCLYYNL